MAIALFFNTGLFAQGKSGIHGKAHVNSVANTRGINTREDARVNGSVNANAHANEIAKRKANSNSVLNTGIANPLHREKKHRHHTRHHRKS